MVGSCFIECTSLLRRRTGWRSFRDQLVQRVQCGAEGVEDFKKGFCHALCIVGLNGFKVFRERVGGGLFFLADGFEFVTEGGKPGVQGQQAGSSLLIRGAFLSVYRLFYAVARLFEEKGLTFQKIVLYYKYIEPMGVSPSQALRRTRVVFATLIYFC